MLSELGKRPRDLERMRRRSSILLLHWILSRSTSWPGITSKRPVEACRRLWRRSFHLGESKFSWLIIETNSRLEYTLVLKALGPLGGDIYLLERACKGAGTHEDLLSEVLLGRSNQEIFLLKEGFRRVYNKDLVKTVQGELSMKTER
jgi:hypothetical protein